MSPAEYVWTGMAMKDAYGAMEAGDLPDGVPAANVELARQYEGQLAELAGGDEPAGVVLSFATMYGGLSGLQDAEWLEGMELEP